MAMSSRECRRENWQRATAHAQRLGQYLRTQLCCNYKLNDNSSQGRQSTGAVGNSFSSRLLIQPCPGRNLHGNKSTYRPNESSSRTSKSCSAGAVEIEFHFLSSPLRLS